MSKDMFKIPSTLHGNSRSNAVGQRYWDESSQMMYVRHHNVRYPIYVRPKSSAICNGLHCCAEQKIGMIFGPVKFWGNSCWNNFCLFVTYSHAGPEGLHNLTFGDLHLSGSKWGHNKIKLSYLGISSNPNIVTFVIIIWMGTLLRWPIIKIKLFMIK